MPPVSVIKHTEYGRPQIKRSQIRTRTSSRYPVSGALVTLGSGESFPPSIQSSGDNGTRVPNILPENLVVHRSVPVNGNTQLGLRSHPIGSSTLEALTTTLLFFRSDKPVCTTAAFRSCSPCYRQWQDLSFVTSGIPIWPFQAKFTIFTDASTQGWGAHMGDSQIAGVWTRSERELHINVLELSVVILALHHWVTILQGHHVLIATDNTTVVAYLNKQGWTHSHLLLQLLVDLFLWLQTQDITLRARHIPGFLNVIADRLSRPNQPIMTEWSLDPEVMNLIFRLWGTPVVDMFATVHNTHLPQFMSPVPEPRALAIDALSQDWQARSMYMFPPFPLLNKVIQKLRTTQTGEVILIAPWWPSQPWFPHLLRLSVDHPQFFQYHRDLLSQQGYISSGKSYHLANWATGRGFDPLGPTAAHIAAFLYELFDTHGLSPQTIKGYRSCLASVLSRTGKAAEVQAKIMSMELQRPRLTPVLPQWDLSIVLEALSKSPYEPLREASFKHLTLKTVFLLAIASGGRRSELQALVFDPQYIQFKPRGAGVTLYFTPEFMRKNQRPNQVNDPWYIPVVPTGKPEFGAPNCPVRALKYYHRYMSEHPDLRKGRRRLFIPFKDNNAGKELRLSATSISRWICATIVDSPASIQGNKNIPGKVKAHEVRAVATSLQLFNRVDLQAVIKAGRWSSGGTFTSFYLRDLCPQADSIRETGSVLAAGGRRVLHPPLLGSPF